ncbi:mitochondrial carrier domain-containing protein [Angomonas deanei]|nr:mitochondrial carrier domain-containing protein [Angomonas deanei]|eukprot:EPY28308.1 mitochondrial carrier domain-containing protein [Angomonas deanei]
MDDHKEGFLFTAGPALVSGAAQAILFNPVDRALYVRVKFRRKRFLDWKNFERPFQGFMNAAVYRTLVGASYMFWQDSARLCIQNYLPSACQKETNPQLNYMLIGLLAGSMNGFALNTLQAVKFRMWNSDARGVTFLQTSRLMYKEGGILIFFRGCVTTMVRDSVFGIVYESVRRNMAWKEFFNVYGNHSADAVSHKPLAPTAVTIEHHEVCESCLFVSSMIAAVVASTLSSPFNYVRSIVYGTPPGSIPLDYMSLLRSFYTQYFYIYRHGKTFSDSLHVPELAAAEYKASGSGYFNSASKDAISQWLKAVGDKYHHHPIISWRWANSRLNIGWGSLRVGVGMALGQSLFHLAQDFIREDHPKNV